LVGHKIKWKNCDGSSGIATTTSSNVIFYPAHSFG